MTFWLNGRFLEETTAINIADRGFLLADGIFETILMKDGAPAFLDAHLARMKASASAFSIPARFDESEIAAVLNDLARRNRASSGFASARLTLTRGAGPRGLMIDKAAAPTLLATVAVYAPAVGGDPLTLIVAAARRSEKSITARHKTLAYLDNILAREEAAAAGADDALMLNHAGRAACASAANLFVIDAAGVVTTPPIEEGALPGVVRAVLLSRATAAGVELREAPITQGDLENAQPFLTNCLMGLRPALMKGAAAAAGGSQRILETLQSCYEQALLEDLEKRALR